MGPITHVSFSNEPRERAEVLVSPCCDQRMTDTDVCCPECGEPCDPVVGENDDE